MGKSVKPGSNPYVLSDEVLNTLPSGKQTAPAQPSQQQQAKNPYVLADDVLLTIPEKKKDLVPRGTESSPTPSNAPSELESKENAIDFLNADIDGNDFFIGLAKNTERYFPSTTPNRVNQQAAEMIKREVFRNPASLQRYTDSRLKKLNEQISNLKADESEQRELKYRATAGQMIDLGVPMKDETIARLQGQILEKENYKNRLKANVADVAADLILSQQDLSKFNPRQIGRQIISISDPDQEAIYTMAEKNGQTLPGIRQAEIERVGLNAVKGYINRNPNIPNRDLAINQVNDYEKDFDERNSDATLQRVREKVGAQIYKEGNGSFFGFGYKAKTIQDAINNPETDLTESEKKIGNERLIPLEKKIIGTDIPTSGFTRSFYNALEKGGIGVGKTLGDITGLRGESDQAQDLLNQEVEQSRYRPPGESPTAQAQLSYLQNKEKTEKLTDKEAALKKDLENYTYVRNGWSKFKDGVGDLTGQVALIALTTKGLGATGQALKASGATGGLLGGMTRSTLGTALSNETVGLFVGSYLNAYDNYKQQAIQLIPGQDKAAEREAYATVMASVEGLSERIFRDTKILDAFTKGVAPSIKDITNKFINREITQQVAKEETATALQKALVPFAKEYAKSTFQESTEEAVVDFAQGAADAIFGGQEFDITKTGQQALNTFLTTALYSPLVSGMAAAGATRRHNAQNTFLKASIVDMAANPVAYLKSVEDLQVDGTINQQQANEKIQLIKSANKFLQEIPATRTVTKKTGEGKEATTETQQVPFDYPEMSSYLVHRLNEGILADQIDNTTDEVLKSKLQQQLKRSRDIRKGLFDGSIAVTTDLQDVTNNPEKAEELGIASSEELNADVLVGTPFETEEIKTNEEKSETKNADTAPAEGQAEAAETKAVETPKITAEQQTEAAQFANELKEEGVIPDTYHSMITAEDATSFWEMVAQQAQNVDANWQPLTGEQNKSEQAAIDAFGETIVNYAKELFPVKQETLKPQQSLAEQKTVAQKGKELADRIRSLKTKKDVAMSDIFGIGTSLYNTSIDIVALAIEQGANLATAINRGVEYIKSNYGEKLNEEEYRRSVIENTNVGIKTKEELTETLNSIEETYNTIHKDSKKYRFIDFEAAINSSGLSDEEVRAAIRKSKIDSKAKNKVEKSIAERAKTIAKKIRDLKSPRDRAQANIFGVAIGVYDGALEVIATAIEQGGALAEAIAAGIKYIRDNGGEQLDETGFSKHIEDQLAGEKPRIKIQVGEEEESKSDQEKEPNQPPPPKQPPIVENEDAEGSIDDYDMTTSGEVNRFLSGETWEDVFGEKAEGDQSYLTQRLSDMLQDGKNMIAIAQQKWGGDVMLYGRPLFQFIQGMSNDRQLSNKKAVLLATFLGELQEAKKRSPERFDAISQLEKAVFAYYQNYMNLRGKEVVAGRLLRLYRDKYIGDIYAERILDKDQVRAKRKVQEVEQKKTIDDTTAQEANQPITQEEKNKEDKAAKAKSKKAKSDQSKKKKLSTDEAKQRAEEKLKEIEEKLGSESKKGLLARIKEAINKLNCK